MSYDKSVTEDEKNEIYEMNRHAEEHDELGKIHNLNEKKRFGK